MKHTQEEILNALHVIKDTCSNVTDIQDCSLCPFNDGDGHCIVNEQAPSCWDIVEKETWRAFE
jgi:hypothetical protein